MEKGRKSTWAHEKRLKEYIKMEKAYNKYKNEGHFWDWYENEYDKWKF